jgi:hypothetical protein
MKQIVLSLLVIAAAIWSIIESAQLRHQAWTLQVQQQDAGRETAKLRSELEFTRSALRNAEFAAEGIRRDKMAAEAKFQRLCKHARFAHFCEMCP